VERATLRVVDPAAAVERRRERRAGSTLATALGVVALVASLAGADQGRHSLDARPWVREAAVEAVTEGLASPLVRETLLRMRRHIRERPLDSRTRATFAALLTAADRGATARVPAQHHADVALRTAPVTVPVVRIAAHVFADTGEVERALAETRRLSAFDPGAAARLLGELEAHALGGPGLEAGLGEHPAAWLAWVDRLNSGGRLAEARLWLGRAVTRWPADGGLVLRQARLLARDERWEELERAVATAGLPGTASNADSFAWRALALGRLRRPGDARAELDRALALRPNGVVVLTVAGELARDRGDPEGARRHWTRALHLAEQARYESSIVDLLPRLARLHEATGEADRAWRTWSRLLELRPGHAESRARVEALGGPQDRPGPP
jgi:tetratricopeptide (TPR) repeat protein